MKFEIEYRGKLYDVEWFEDTDFESLGEVHGAHGFVFDENDKILVINISSKPNWTIPGGGKEDYDENLEATFIRETDEEADIELKDVKRVGYFKVNPKRILMKYSTKLGLSRG